MIQATLEIIFSLFLFVFQQYLLQEGIGIGLLSSGLLSVLAMLDEAVWETLHSWDSGGFMELKEW